MSFEEQVVTGTRTTEQDADHLIDLAGQLIDRASECLRLGRFDDLDELLRPYCLEVHGVASAHATPSTAARFYLSSAEDIWILPLRILRHSVLNHAAQLRATCYVVWSPVASWTDHEVEFDLEIEFECDGTRCWTISKVRLLPPTPEVVPFPEVGGGS